MTKIVINTCFGGFGLSKKALKRYNEVAKYPVDYDWEIHRDDPALVQVVEELGDKVKGKYSSLKVVEIPDNIEWYIHDYDGKETVHEKHKSWR